MTIDERLARLIELLAHEGIRQGIRQGERTDKILEAVNQDTGNIRHLANIAGAC